MNILHTAIVIAMAFITSGHRWKTEKFNENVNQESTEISVPCDAKNNCKNKALCKDSDGETSEEGFCACGNGLSGDLCEIVDGCEALKCNEKKGMECIYDGTGGGICSCEDTKKLFDPDKKECRIPCDAKNNCKNKAVCKDSDGETSEEGFCACRNGLSGDLCEIVDGCEALKCNEKKGMECIYDGTGGGICSCEDTKKLFDPDKKECRIPCDAKNNCKNKAVCKDSDGETSEEGFCACGNGLSGDLCEIVDGCEALKCNEKKGMECIYDGTGEGICSCEDTKKLFDPDKKECRIPCDAKNNCKNKAVCKDSDDETSGEGFCACGIGLSGDLCEIVDGCEALKCNEKKDMECIYDGTGGRICSCEDTKKLFDPDKKECRIPCDAKNNCKNKAVCKDSDGETSEEGFCACGNGLSGDLCEIVDGCEALKCNEKKGMECIYDGTGGGICSCEDTKKLFDPDKKECRIPCDAKNNCKNKAVCKDSDGETSEEGFCACGNGLSGDLCEIVDGCEALKCNEKKGMECIYDGTGEGICSCEDTKKLFDPDKKECRIPCDAKNNCKNKAVCKDSDDETSGEGFCACGIGLSGDLCEIVDGCEALKCNEKKDMECIYDGTGGRICSCEDTKKLFDPDKKECRIPCDAKNNCKNKAVCKDSDGETSEEGFCACGNGLSGDLCEIVDGCEALKCNEKKGMECIYDGTGGGICSCEDTKKLFDPDKKECRIPCDAKNNCKNKAVCKDSDGDTSEEGFCACGNGLSGDLCEIVDGCEALKCNEKKGMECIYDGTGGGICSCEDTKKLFDPDKKECRIPCDASNNCKNKVVCKDSDGETSERRFCACGNGLSGDFCEIVDGCETLKCNEKKGMECIYDGRSGGICSCEDTKKLFDHNRKECRIPCDANNNCKNKAVCKDSDGERSEKGFCSCGNGLSGDFCEIVDECEALKCNEKKGMECIYDGSSGGICSCTDTNTLFDPDIKECRMDYCASKPCQNGGNCTNGNDTYDCACPDFYGGKDCSKNTWCETYGQEECGNEKCKYNATIGKGECICEDGKVFNYLSKNCIEDYCNSSPCKNGGTCINDEDAYNCTCAGVYGGTNCEDIIWCDIYGADFCGNVTCENDEITEKGYCKCANYQIFDETSSTCIAMDACIPKLVNGKCSSSHEICENGACKCETNYKYSADEKECLENFCSSNNCGLNAKCQELGNGEDLCVCNKGYFMSKNKCIKINLCSMKDCTQKCEEGVCSCEEGFTLGNDNKTCNAKNEESVCDDLDCGQGTCIKTTKGSKCVCPSSRFDFKNNTCIDKCTVNKGKPPPYTCPTSECEPTDDIKGFRCKCENPYELDEDGVHCKRKRMCEDSGVLEKCEKQSARCQEDQTSTEGYKCVCDVGFEKDKNVCTRKCDMKKYSDKCAALNAICELDEKQVVKCTCPPMLTREGNDENKPCNLIAPHSYLGKLSVLKSLYELQEPRRSKRSLKNVNMLKLGDDMRKSLINVYGELDDLKILDCDDEANVLACSIEIQLKKKPEVVNKIASPTVCIPVDEEYCLVKPSLLLKREEDNKDLFHETHPCSEEVTSRLCETSTECTSTDDVNFQCRCRKGFYAIGFYNPVTNKETFVERCNDIDECVKSNACPNTTDCVNKYGDYDCYCKDKHKKKNENSNAKKEGCEALCSPSPCGNGTCIIVGNHGFSCKCHESFTGMFCNETAVVAVKLMDQTNAAIVGGVLGTLLVIVLIAGVVLYRKMQTDKEEEDEYAKHRQKSVLSEMTRLGRRQNDRDRDIELHGSNRTSRLARQDSGEYRRGFQEERIIPRAQTSRGRDEYLDDKKVSSEPEMSRRPAQRESKDEPRRSRNVSNMQYRNRGYEEE